MFCENSWIKLELTQTIEIYYSTFILLKFSTFILLKFSTLILLKSTCTRYEYILVLLASGLSTLANTSNFLCHCYRAD